MSRLLLLIFLLLPLVSAAQQDTVKLNEVEISATRTPSVYSSEIRPVILISKKELNALPLRDPEEFLAYQPGFDLRQRGVNGVQSDLGVRGGSFEQTLILLNGIGINDPQSGHHNLDLPIDPGQAERIEILKGPGTRLYGTNAFAGVINIITAAGNKKHLDIALSGGMHGLFSGSLGAGFRTGNIHHYIQAGGKTCDGYMKNTDYSMGRAFYHGLTRFGNARLQWQAGYLDKSFGANSFYSAKYPDQFERTRTEFAALQFDTGKKIRLLPSVYWRRHHDRFELFRNQAPTWYANHNYHMTDVLGGMINFSAMTTAGRTAGGMEFRYEHIYSNVLGEPMSEMRTVPGEENMYFNRSSQRQHLSAFADHHFDRGRFSAGGGLLLHYNPVYGAGLYPGFDAGVRIFGDSRVYLSVNRALRLPTFTDLFYVGPMNEGNPDLKPEKSWNFEMGSELNYKGISAGLAAFYRSGREMIDWVKFPGDVKWKSENVTRLNTSGMEIRLGITPSKFTKKRFFIQEVVIDYSWITAGKVQSDYISYYLLDYLKHKAVCRITHGIYRKLGASWGVNFRDRAGTYTDPDGGQEEEYRPFFTLDGKIYWDVKGLQLYISATNLTNTQYRDFGNIPMPGRWLVCGLKIHLEK